MVSTNRPPWMEEETAVILSAAFTRKEEVQQPLQVLGSSLFLLLLFPSASSGRHGRLSCYLTTPCAVLA